MSEPTPTPEKQDSPTPGSEETRQNDADKNTSSPERDGFFRRVRRGLHEPIHPSEAEEIVVMDDADRS